MATTVADGEQEKEEVAVLKEGKFYTRGNSDALNAFLAQITGKDSPKVLPAFNYSYSSNRHKFCCCLSSFKQFLSTMLNGFVVCKFLNTGFTIEH